jgi:cytidylate kinase
VKCISLIADEDNLQRRLTRDVQKGIRKEDVIDRSIARIPLYQKLDTVKVDTNNKTIAEIVAEIAQL